MPHPTAFAAAAAATAAVSVAATDARSAAATENSAAAAVSHSQQQQMRWKLMSVRRKYCSDVGGKSYFRNKYNLKLKNKCDKNILKKLFFWTL